jgi:hypothetical protein
MPSAKVVPWAASSDVDDAQRGCVRCPHGTSLLGLLPPPPPVRTNPCLHTLFSCLGLYFTLHPRPPIAVYTQRPRQNLREVRAALGVSTLKVHPVVKDTGVRVLEAGSTEPAASNRCAAIEALLLYVERWVDGWAWGVRRAWVGR